MGKVRHWYIELVVPGSCTESMLPKTTEVLDAATGGAPMVGTGALEEVEEEISTAQVELGPSVAWAPDVQTP